MKSNNPVMLYASAILMTVAIIFFVVNIRTHLFSKYSDARSANLSISCHAFGVVKINGYSLRYVSSYRLTRERLGYVTVSGKVFKGEEYLGILGLQSTFRYTINGDIINATGYKYHKQTENEVSDEIISKVVPKVYYSIGSTQLIGLVKIGNGYRLDYNSYPTTYCL